MGQREILKFLQQEASIGNNKFLSLEQITISMIECGYNAPRKHNMYHNLKMLHKFGYLEMNNEKDRWRVRYRAVIK